MNLDPRRNEDLIFLSDGAKYWLGSAKEIIYLKVSGNYTMFHLSNGQKLNVHGSLGKWEARLPSIFFRAGRNEIINLSQVKDMRAHSAKQLAFTMTGGSEIIMSRHQSLLFRKLKSL